MEAESFSLIAPCTPSQPCTDAVNGVLMEESTESSSYAESVSSVEFAGQFSFPSVFDCEDDIDADVPSAWSLNAPSISCSQPNWASAGGLYHFSGDIELGAKSNIALNSRCTTLYLKDIASNSYEEILFDDENKISTIANSDSTDLKGSIAD